MNRRLEYPRRLSQCGLSLLALLILSVLFKAAWLVKAVSIGAGLVFGYFLGVASWRRLQRRVLANNVLITYFEDSAWAAVLLAVYLSSLAPRSILLPAGWLSENPVLTYAIGLVLAAACTSYAWALYRGIRTHERSKGALVIKSFYARSVSGAEGLLGRVANVVEPCDPEGRVMVGPELWSARSLDGGTLAAGTQVVVRDIEGLRLIVERSLHGA